MTKQRTGETLGRAPVQWPDELTELEFSFRDSVSRGSLEAAARDHNWAADRPPTVSLLDASEPLVARITTDSSEPLSLLVSITPGRVESLEAWDLPELLGALGVSGGEVEVTSFHFLSSEKWESQLPLPLTLPVIPGDAGGPQVTGFEFTFRDPAFPTRSIMISRRDDAFFCYITQALVLDESSSLLQRSIELAEKGRALVAKPHDQG